MTGLLLAISATVMWSLNNILDKVLVQRFGANGGVRALVILSALFPTVMVPICIFSGAMVDLSAYATLVLLLSGLAQIAWIWLYMLALHRADVTIVMPLMALSPVAAWIFGLTLLDEMPSFAETAACAIIVLGAIILTYEHHSRRINLSLLMLGLAASALAAATNALFKLAVGTDEGYWSGMYWQSIGTILFGLALFWASKQVRIEFRDFFADNAVLGIGINATNESVTLVGNALFSQAVLYGQIAVIQSMEALQPVFVFILGAVLARLSPRHLSEDLSMGTTIKKLLGIAIICAGTIMLFMQWGELSEIT